jgi:3-dehydroquinate synthase
METISLNFAATAGTSQLLLGRGAIGALASVWSPAWEQAALIGDERVLDLFAAGVEQSLAPAVGQIERFGFPAGEANKNRTTKQSLEDRMLDAGFTRRCCVVGIGGGVSLDLAGFVAATYLRGVPSVYLPTSLLAQVDASVGGKTGVNTRHGKNLIGAFCQPTWVGIDPDLPASLSVAEWRNGLAEMVKHALVADAELFSRFEREASLLAGPTSLDVGLLARCVSIKADLVRTDEREAGRRAWLNLGHTVGHALERASDYRLAHGEAVARGLLVECRLAVERCGFLSADLGRLEALLHDLGFGDLDPGPFAEAEPHLWMDKKNRSGAIHAVLPRAIGAMASEGDSATLAVEVEAFAKVWQA